MESPSPVPFPTSLVVKKGSKIFSWISGRIPSPVSRTDNCTKVPGLQIRFGDKIVLGKNFLPQRNGENATLDLHGVERIGGKVHDDLVNLGWVCQHHSRVWDNMDQRGHLNENLRF